MSDTRFGTVVLGVILAAMAAGMGWGIRGQYGHETGAMMAGVLFSLVIVFLYGSRLTSLTGARAAALCALGISIGGSMTYGQTVGLTHDAPLIGNIEALRWGLLGLFIKGGIWIGFGGVMLGIGLSGIRYRSLEMILLLLALVMVFFFGVWLINSPFDPANKQLPWLYFSDHWRWEPEGNLEPRPEVWGGLLLALVTLIGYARVAKGDRLALRLSLWAIFAGGIGFTLGQALQSYHAWHPEFYEQEFFAKFPQQINWWNFMETIFGATWGAILALGVGLNRHLIAPPEEADVVEITPLAEWLLVLVHVGSIVGHEFADVFRLDMFMSYGITMILIPIPCVLAGRYWPYLMTLPVIAAPIAGKTVRELCFNQQPPVLPVLNGALAYIVLPLTLMTLLAVLFARRGMFGEMARSFARWALLLVTWTYFWLNFAFFRYPWPWEPIQSWTGRTPNGLVFAKCAIVLTLAALAYGWRGNPTAAPAESKPQRPKPQPPPRPQPKPQSPPPDEERRAKPPKQRG